MTKETAHKRNNVLTFPVAAPYDVAYKHSQTATPVGPHSHNAAELYFTLSDLPDVLLNDTVSAVPSGTLIIIPAFCVHQLYHGIDVMYERYILSINTQWLDEVFGDNADSVSYLKQSTVPLLLTPDATQRNEFIHRINDLLSFPKPATPEAMTSFFHLLSLLNEMVNGLSPEGNQDFPISSGQKMTNEMIAYIQEHIYENLTVADLASHFYLHPDYLARVFKRHAHTTLSHYITLQKIATAQSLLRDGCTVAEVQEKLSYSSYSYFFKTFQKNTGMSPSKYRTQYFKQEPKP